MNLVTRRTAAIALGGLSLAATLAGCSVASEASSGSSTGGAQNSDGGPYADGDYSATGTYQSPGGTETIEVEVTLEDDTITAVTVDGNATQGNAVRFQGEFEDGIAAEVVGVSIDELSVDKVAGSSLTSDGFNDAIEQIKAQAVA